MMNTRGGYGPSSLSEDQQARLFGLHRHVKVESAAEERAAAASSSTVAGGGAKSVTFAPSTVASEPPLTAPQQLAYDQCRALSADDAKREFLTILFSTAPYWKYEQFM
jgi:hypothetical protein